MKKMKIHGALATTLAFAAVARCQNVTGAVTGIVTDASGAVLPGATIVAHNVDTGVDSQAKTDASGLYRIRSLPIGHYELRIVASGFGEADVPAFTLEAVQTATFNVGLKPGSASEQIDVSTAPPILNTEDPTISATFSANTIQDFPLNGLDFSAITLYVPGAVSTAGTSGTNNIGRSTYYTDSVNINGGRAQANNYTLDGIDINETFNNLIAYSPAPDSLAEIKVITSNAPADYGNVNGGDVVSVLKSGTNNLHGSAYGFVQDYRFNANSYANKQTTPVTPVNPYSQAQFGGTLGGPIVKDKLFFFVDYLGSRFHRGGTTSTSVLTQAMRGGDFSALLAAANPVQLYDSQNNYAPYLNNRGVAIVNPVAKYLFAHPELYPLPNAAPEDGIAENNYQGSSRSYTANNQGDIKIEYDPRPADKFTGFYSMGTAYNGSTALLAITFPTVSIYPTKVFGINWVHVISPSLVNSARIGFTRTVWDTGLPQDTTGLFGTNGNAVVGINFPNQTYQGFTYQGISGLSGVGTPAQFGGLTDNTYSYIDDLTWQRGRHTISFGVQALRYQNNYPTSNNDGYLGTLSYTGAYTGNVNAGSSGYGGADFLLDRVSEAAATLSSVNVGQRQWRAAGYVSDAWKATPKLTVTLGARYEFDQPWIESNNKTGNIDLTTGQVIYADHVPTGAPAGSGVCSNRACYQPNYRQIMPRLGVAYQATGRFVIRAGYGATSFYEGNSSNQRLTSITPFIQAVDAKALQPGATTGGTPRTAEQGFTGGSVQYGGTFNVYPQNIQPAYVQEWNLTTEYALSKTMSLTVGYLGNQGQHIEDYGNVNQWRTPGDPTSAPFYNNKYLGVNAVDPSISIGENPLLITESRAAMSYNALQATLRERLNRGLEFMVNYTYSKSLTNSLGNYGLNVSGFSGAFQNYYDSASDWGPAGYDVRHNVSATATYRVPVGHGRQYFANSNRFVDEVFGGWRISPTLVAYSGLPQTPTGGSNGTGQTNSYGNNRPNQYRTLKIRNRSLTNWFGTDPSATFCTTPGVDNGVCAFGQAADGAFGTARNGSLRGPGFLNVNTSASKDFHLFREHTLGVSADIFNVFNIVSYGNPDTGVTSATFGNVINQTVRSTERQFQFSARYRF